MSIAENIARVRANIAAAAKAPVNAPNSPLSAPRMAPFAKRYPNPEMGTVAPAPAKSTRY